jgi:hypothetical protein
MIVITRNGKTTVLTGWRAWLTIAGALLAAWLLLAFLAFIVIGTAVTVGALLLILAPAAVLAGLLASLFRSPR